MPNFDKKTIYRGFFFFFLTLTRSKADHKNQTIPSSTHHTIQNARPRWINTNAILTHCWMSHAFSLPISFCFLIRVTFNKKGPRKRKNLSNNYLSSSPKGGCILHHDCFLKSWMSQLLQSRNKSLLRKEPKWKEGKLVLRLHEQCDFVPWFILEEEEEQQF